MTHDERERLLQDVLDGVADPNQVEKLKQQLKTDEALRLRHAELDHLFGLLRQVELEEPPADLRSSVLQSIRAERSASTPRSSWRAGWAQQFGGRPTLRLAYAFVTGITIGGVGLFYFSHSLPLGSPTPLPISGTMMPTQAETGARLLHSNLKLSSGRIEVTTRSTSSAVELVLESTSSEPVEIEAKFDPDQLRPAGLDWDPLGPAPVLPETGLWRVRMRGHQTARLRFEPRTDRRDIDLTAHSGTETVKTSIRMVTSPSRP